MRPMTDARERLRQAGELIPPPEDPFERLVRRRDRQRRRDRVLAAGLSLTLVAGVLGGALFVLSKTGSKVGHQAPLGGSSGSTGPGRLALGEGQYLYTRFRQVMPGWGFEQQSWWATDGSGRTKFDCSTPHCTDPNCQTGQACDGYGGYPDGAWGPGKFPTDDDMTGLSTDPAQLLPELLDRTSPGGKSPEPAFSPGPELTPGVTVGGLLDAIENILGDPNGTPELKAAVFEVASGIDGVTVSTGAIDPVGRPATKLSWSLDGSQTAEYYFDPGTGLLMATDWSGQSGTYAVYDQGIVSSTDDVPTGDQWLFGESPAPSPTP